MAQKYSDTNYIISLLKTNLNFKSDYDRYNLNKKIKKEDMTDITTQLAHLYAISTKSNNNITIINNMHKDDKTDNEDLLKQIQQLKKENKKLKEENEELKSKPIVESSDEESDKVSKKKYDRVIKLKNKYFDEANEYKNKIQKLENEIKEIKEQYNITEDNKPLDVLNEDYSDEEEDEDTYQRMEEVEQKQKEKQLQEENTLSQRDTLLHNLDEQRQLLKVYQDENNDKKIRKIQKRISIIENELQKI